MSVLVSVIIVNYNGKKFLQQCLSSLFSVSYTDYEVILVDNNSSDGSVDFVQQNFPDIRIKQLEQNFGFAKANNIGANIARGDLFLFLNNDTKVTEGFLEPLVDELQSNDTAICQSLLLRFDGTVDSAGDFVDNYGRPFNSKIIPEKISPILSARGACMMVKKDIFEKLGGFDEKFFVSFEDVDIGWRAWIYGYKVMVVPKSVVYHHGGGTVSTMSDMIQFHGAKNALILRLTNFDIFQSLASIVFLFIYAISRKIFDYSMIPDLEENHNLPSFSILVKAGFWVFSNFRYILNKKRLVFSKKIYATKWLIAHRLIRKNHQ